MLKLPVPSVWTVLLLCLLGLPAWADSQPQYVNTLRWTTASEVNNFGYDIYRAENPDGPFERINPQPVPGAGTSDVINRYEYIDAAIDPSLDYYYYIESISINGIRRRFTAVRPAAAKLNKNQNTSN